MLRNIYIICLTVGGAYAALSFIFSNLMDFDFDFDFGGFVLPVKPFTIMTFAAVFGGSGLIALSYINPLATLAVSVPIGCIVSGGLYNLLFVKLRKCESLAPTEDDTMFTCAEVVERIAPGSYGKISYVLNGNILSGAAKEFKPGNGIEKGRRVHIMDVRDNTYFVCEDLQLYYNELTNQ